MDAFIQSRPPDKIVFDVVASFGITIFIIPLVSKPLVVSRMKSSFVSVFQ
ncbi:hypothetical protein [Pedobacter steynii]